MGHTWDTRGTHVGHTHVGHTWYSNTKTLRITFVSPAQPLWCERYRPEIASLFRILASRRTSGAVAASHATLDEMAGSKS